MGKKRMILFGMFFGFVFLLLTNSAGFGQSATLNSPAWNGDQFQFNLEGDSYRRYVIQGSSNLQDWVSLTTNVSPSAARLLNFATSNGFTFYRSAPYTRTNLLGKAIQLTGSFDSRGNNFLADSFNSTNSAFSTDGQYDPSKRRDMAELSFDQGLTNSTNSSESIVYITVFGSIAIGPQTPLIIGSNGSIGSLAWIYDAHPGVQPGKLTTDLNPYFPEAQLPFTQAMVPPGGNITNYIVTNGVTNVVVEFYDHLFLNDGDYAVDNLLGKSFVGGNVRVYVSRRINLTGISDGITIWTNASLKLYVGGTNAVFGGNGIINSNVHASNFIYYGMSVNTNLAFVAHSSFAGIIYAPQAHVTFGGGEATSLDLMGAVVARSVDLNGLFRFHYDEALRELSFP